MHNGTFEDHEKIHLICEAGLDRKAENIVIMEMKDRSAFCDYFVIMSAPSTVRVKAIADHIEEMMNENDFKTRHREGYQEGQWVLLDFGDTVAHIFQHDARVFYGLEGLWGDTKQRSFIKS